nr:hypothetical protein [Tanacetum cinerariifolium]
VVEVVGVCESGGERQGSEEEGAAVVGRKNGQKYYSTSFKRMRDDGIFGHLTLLVPVVM